MSNSELQIYRWKTVRAAHIKSRHFGWSIPYVLLDVPSSAAGASRMYARLDDGTLWSKAPTNAHAVLLDWRLTEPSQLKLRAEKREWEKKFEAGGG